MEPPLWQARMKEELAHAPFKADSHTSQDEMTPNSLPMPGYAFSKNTQDAEKAKDEDVSQGQPLGLHMTNATSRVTCCESNVEAAPNKPEWTRCQEWRGEKRVRIAAVTPRHPGIVLPLTKPQHAGSHAIKKALPPGSLGARRQGGAHG